MDPDQRYAVQNAFSMEVFAEGEPTFIYGEWKAWRQACLTEGRAIPPAEYKKPKPALDA